MPHDKHGEDGKFTATYDPDEFVAAVDALELPTTADVAERVDCPHRTALHHLNKLEDQGGLASRKVGPAKVWRVADEPAPSERRERGVTPSEDTADQHPGSMTDERDGATAPTGVESFEFNRDLNDARREQLVAWLNHAAAESEGVQLSDFKDWWTDDRAAETGYNAGSFWEAFAKAAMKQADEFQKPDARTYRYVDAAADQDQDSDTDPLDESTVYDPTDEFGA